MGMNSCIGQGYHSRSFRETSGNLISENEARLRHCFFRIAEGLQFLLAGRRSWTKVTDEHY